MILFAMLTDSSANATVESDEFIRNYRASLIVDIMRGDRLKKAIEAPGTRARSV